MSKHSSDPVGQEDPVDDARRLRLLVRDPRGNLRWSWVLTDVDGTELVSHDVEIDAGSTFAVAFDDPLMFVGRGSELGRRHESETDRVEALGDWIGAELLGPVGEEIVARAPITVEVLVPPSATSVMYRPWELARVGGKSLVIGGVRFVFVPEDHVDGAIAPVGDRLRLLALFSLPVGEPALTLRRERHELTKLVRRLADDGRAVEMTTLQYGVTRDALASTVAEPGGWDVLHVSGHGLGGGFFLEGPRGVPDLVDAATLTEILRPLRGIVKLAVLSTCDSWAPAAARTMHALQLTVQADAFLRTALAEDAPAVGTTAIGETLLEGLDCAVLGMRFPVDDVFAARLTESLYVRLLDRGEPLDVALRDALPVALNAVEEVAPPALSVGTPVLLGSRATGLRLRAPEAGWGVTDPTATASSQLPDEPERFVGQTGLLTGAGEALSESGEPVGVLLHGMPGIGKSTCALELAHRHLATFSDVVYWSARTFAEHPEAALSDLGARLVPELADLGERDDAAFDAALRTLSALLARERLLVVLDDMDPLQALDGTWQTERWRRTSAALTGHGGAARVVMTARTVPPELDPETVVILSVPTLTRPEAILLARELPEIVQMLDAPDGDGPMLVSVAIDMTKGHPRLLELADIAFEDERDPAIFGPRDARPALRFLEELDAWIAAAIENLDDEARSFLRLLATLEGQHRNRLVLGGAWPMLASLRPGDLPEDFRVVAQRLARAGLVDEEAFDGDMPRASVHPSVADAVLARDGRNEDVTKAIAMVFVAVADQSFVQETGHGRGPEFVAMAMAAMPYLLRSEQWFVASTLLRRVASRDKSPETLMHLLAYADELREGTDDPDDADALIRRLENEIDPDPDGGDLRAAVDVARANGDQYALLDALGSLATYLVFHQGAHEAVGVCDEMEEIAARLGVGPWTRLDIEGRKLQALQKLGRNIEVLRAGEHLRKRMAALPIEREDGELLSPWSVREPVLSTLRAAARATGQFELEAELADEHTASQRARGAISQDRVKSAMDRASTLYMHDRIDEAEEMLDIAHAGFTEAGDVRHLALAFDLRGNIAARRGDPQAALEASQAAFRLAYGESDPDGEVLAGLHDSVGVRLARLDDHEQDEVAAHLMAAALLCYAYDLSALSGQVMRHMDELGTSDWRPADFAALAEQVDRFPHSRFGATMRERAHDASELEGALKARVFPRIIRFTGELRDIEWWTPPIFDLADLCLGDEAAGAQFSAAIAEMEGVDRWQPLIDALLRIRAGERGADLYEGLDDVGDVLVRAALLAIEQGPR